MNRRAFLSAVLAAPIAHELEPVRRVYSFLWAPPEPRFPGITAWLPDDFDPDTKLVLGDPSNLINFTEVLKSWYPPERVRSLTMGDQRGLMSILSVDREFSTFTVGQAT